VNFATVALWALAVLGALVILVIVITLIAAVIVARDEKRRQ
jgi:inner membrane protein involved in colicin E2 resistance